MLICHVNNNALISGAYCFGGYQDESENWDLFKNIHTFLGGGQKNCWNWGSHHSSNNQHMKKLH